MHLEGNGISKIRKHINKQHILRSAAYAAEQGGAAGYERYFEGNEENRYIWSENSVRGILRSPIYAGNLAGYKRIAANMKSKKRPDIIDCVQYTYNNYGRYGNVMCTAHAIEARLKEVTETLNENYEKSQRIRDFLSLIRNYQGLKELDATIVNALIDKILVSEHEKMADATVKQEIKIYYNSLALSVNSMALASRTFGTMNCKVGKLKREKVLTTSIPNVIL